MLRLGFSARSTEATVGRATAGASAAATSAAAAGRCGRHLLWSGDGNSEGATVRERGGMTVECRNEGCERGGGCKRGEGKATKMKDGAASGSKSGEIDEGKAAQTTSGGDDNLNPKRRKVTR